MPDFLYDLWLAIPPLSNLGFSSALALGSMSVFLAVPRARPKPCPLPLKALAVALFCFASLSGMAVAGAIALASGAFGMARGWASFAEGYLWGSLFASILALPLAFAIFALPSIQDRSSARKSDRME